MTKALIYCRMSKNDKESDSLERQEAVCQKYAIEKGYEVITVLKELPGTSGAKFDATELSKAIKAAKAGLYQVLIVRDIARFGRDRLKFELKTLELFSYNVTVEFVWQQFDDTPAGKLNKNIMVDFEEFKRASIAKHLTEGRRDKVELFNSFLVHGRPPLGYRTEKEGKIFKLLIDSFEAEIVKTIFNLYVIENYSLNEVAKYLNDNRVPCWSQLRKNSNFGDENSKWSPASVRVVLKNTVYKGEFKYGRVGRKEITKIVGNEIVTVYEKKKNEEDYILTLKVDAIIDETTWNKAQEKLGQNKNNSGRPTKYEYLLARHVTCQCDSKMCGSRRKGKNDKLWLYYHCPKHDKRNDIACLQNNVNAGKIDTLAWQWLEALLRDRDKLRKRIEEYVEDKDRELKPLYEEVGRLDEVINRRRKEYHKLVDLYLSSSDFGQQELLPRKLDIESKLQADETKRKELQAQLDDLGKSVEWLKWYLGVYNSFDSKEEQRNFATLLSSTQNTLVNAKGEKAFGKEYINFQELADLTEDRELTFEEKRKYVERFHLEVKLLGEGKILVSCDFTQEILSLYESDRNVYIPVAFPPFIIHFSEELKLDFSTLPQFRQAVKV